MANNCFIHHMALIKDMHLDNFNMNFRNMQKHFRMVLKLKKTYPQYCNCKYLYLIKKYTKLPILLSKHKNKHIKWTHLWLANCLMNHELLYIWTSQNNECNNSCAMHEEKILKTHVPSMCLSNFLFHMYMLYGYIEHENHYRS